MDAFHQDFFTTADGAPLYFAVHGEGAPAVVLLDGLGCDGFAWKYLLPALKREHRVLHWHYRGHGKSGVPADLSRIGMGYICEDLAALLDHLGIDRVVAFGHSMGVQVALEFHRRHAHRVRALGLLCGSYGNPLDTIHDDNNFRVAFPIVQKVIERFHRPLDRVKRRLLKTDLALEFAIRSELNPKLLKKDDFVPYMAHLADMDLLVWERTLASLAEHSAWDHLPHVDVPTLVIGGERDRFTPIWLSTRMAGAIPKARFVALPGGSHTALLEHAPRVEREVLDFLANGVEGRPHS